MILPTPQTDYHCTGVVACRGEIISLFYIWGFFVLSVSLNKEIILENCIAMQSWLEWKQNGYQCHGLSLPPKKILSKQHPKTLIPSKLFGYTMTRTKLHFDELINAVVCYELDQHT